MDYSKIITIEPGKRSGKPTIRGTRMTVTDVGQNLFFAHAAGEVFQHRPQAEEIKACLAFAADRERKLATKRMPVFSSIMIPSASLG